MKKRVETQISSITDFFKWVKESFYVDCKICGEDWKWLQDSVYYRGHSIKSWELIPGVFRQDNKYGYMDEFKILDIAQHYGLKTRLLDVTFNPLIALYFACSENLDKDGIVYCGHMHELGITNKNVFKNIPEIISEYLFSNDSFSDFLTWCKNKKYKIKWFTKPLFVQPPVNNPRIEAQSGAFIMAHITNRSNRGYKINNNRLDDCFDKRVAIIPYKHKESILKELTILNINPSTIFRDVVGKLQTIMQNENWRANKEVLLYEYLH